MKYFSTLLVLMALLAIGSGCCSGTRTLTIPMQAEKSNIETINMIEDTTVALVSGNAGERVAYCAGVWIENKKIITAGHCVEMAGRRLTDTSPLESYNSIGDIVMFLNHSDAINEEIPQDKVWLGIVEQFDAQLDLATIKALDETSPYKIAKIIDEPIMTGQLLHIIGHTVGITWSYSRGYVSNSRKVEGPGAVLINTIQASAPVWSGNSGGGAFDSDGHLIGICSWVNTRAPNIAFFIHHDEVLKFLKNK